MKHELEEWVLKAVAGHNTNGINLKNIVDFIDYFNREPITAAEIEMVLKELQKSARVRKKDETWFLA